MWDLITTLLEAIAEADEAKGRADFHARQEYTRLRDWMIRQRLGIPPVADDIQ